MSVYHYLSLTPEAWISSMLAPREFGAYLAVGTRKRTRGHAIYVALRDTAELPANFAAAERLCVPHPSGEPKRSVYLAIYRVLERTPLAALGSFFLVTPDGKVLELAERGEAPVHTEKFHLYQEISPVHPRVASTLAPREFAAHLTAEDSRIHVPKICFVDLRLGELAENPESGSIHDLPYQAIDHLRDCLMQLQEQPGKHTKIVDRTQPQVFPYRAVETGVYVGDGRDLLFYPFPSEEELQTRYYDWWRSASIMGDTLETFA